MNFLLWKITMEPYRLAKLQWLLFKLFNIKPKDPCGHTKSTPGFFCHQPWDVKRCDVINKCKVHKIVCKCCGSTRISSSHYLDPNVANAGEWFSFNDVEAWYEE